jgi:hypothetical protein
MPPDLWSLPCLQACTPTSSSSAPPCVPVTPLCPGVSPCMPLVWAGSRPAATSSQMSRCVCVCVQGMIRVHAGFIRNEPSLHLFLTTPVHAATVFMWQLGMWACFGLLRPKPCLACICSSLTPPCMCIAVDTNRFSMTGYYRSLIVHTATHDLLQNQGDGITLCSAASEEGECALIINTLR